MGIRDELYRNDLIEILEDEIRYSKKLEISADSHIRQMLDNQVAIMKALLFNLK